MLCGGVDCMGIGDNVLAKAAAMQYLIQGCESMLCEHTSAWKGSPPGPAPGG